MKLGFWSFFKATLGVLFAIGFAFFLLFFLLACAALLGRGG